MTKEAVDNAPSAVKYVKANGKAIAGVVALIAVMGMVIQPIRNDTYRLRMDFDNHVTQGSHPGAAEKMAVLREKFIEVETQFANLDERTSRIEKGSEHRDEMQREAYQTEIRLSMERIDAELAWIKKELAQLEGKH